jgi:DnaJ like chaperone protein
MQHVKEASSTGLRSAILGPLGAGMGYAISDTLDAQHEKVRTAFFVYLFACLAKIAQADGKISTEETTAIATVMKEDLKLDDDARKMAISIFQDARDNETSFEDYVACFADLIGYDIEVGTSFLYTLHGIAAADGHVSDNERQLLLQAERVLHIDPGTIEEILNQKINDREKNRVAFFIYFFTCLAKIAKADGRISAKETTAVVAIMKDGLKLDDDAQKMAISIFKAAKDNEASFEEYVTCFGDLIGYDVEIGTSFLYALHQIAAADGHVSDCEQQFLMQAEQRLHLVPGTVAGILGNGVALNVAYQVLNCHPDMTDQEISAAYQNKCLQFHPEHILQHGLPPEFKELANTQLAQFNLAYEQIRASRRLIHQGR